MITVDPHAITDGRSPKTDYRFHRPLSAIHLQPTSADLFIMAPGRWIGVIYIIIANEMKTLQNNAVNLSTNRIHSFMAIAGVLIAIVCGLVLMNSFDQGSVRRSMNTTGDGLVSSGLMDNFQSGVRQQVVKVSVHSLVSVLK